jgi:aminopeptidase N
MQHTGLLATALLGAALVAPGRVSAADAAHAVSYELDVKVRDADLAVTETIRFTGSAPAKLALDLVPEMKVLGVESSGKAAPFDVGKGGVAVDLSGVASKDGGFAVALRLEGAPREQFSSAGGGYLRSSVGPDFAYVRSQVAWYARVPGDLATYRTIVDVKAGRLVRTAGIASTPEKKGDRDVVAFESAVPEQWVGLVAGAWTLRELAAAGGTVFEAFHRPGEEKGADAVLAAAKRAFDFCGAWLGKASPARFTVVEMPETFGASSGYGESGYVLVGPGAFATPPANVSLVAHEVAHTWWGHAVLFSEWPSEALASYTTTKFVEADQGADAARDDRRSSVEQVLRAADAGKEAALADLRGFGGGMDPETYASHAYGKGKMLLVMVEDAVGDAAMKKLLARFIDENRGKTVGWSEVRAALVGAGPAAKAVVEQWEKPGVPRLSIEPAKTAKAGKCAGTLKQEGTPRPYRMNVVLAAKCGDKVVTSTVLLDKSETAFEFAVPSAPTSVVVDPDWRLLAARPAPGGEDAKKLLDEGIQVATNPKEDDPAVLTKAIEQLRAALATGSPDMAGTCHVGIGRCLFNLGKLDDAKKELEEGLRAGTGPFHRSWANLRLGNIADLQKRRKDAVKYYEAVVSGPAAKNLEFQQKLAKRFLDTPYRGFKEDG